ncbi:hypothetical protein FH972_005591 [Carpinus fangiana]|uniref:Uncharacterized protein n=1 Tax=Carpinus fangiana TaxID=176857 RepID=A0A5N6QRK3_9ROSI|nr:hypothetical protein FH972_005591 [Carpinus fangiana]
MLSVNICKDSADKATTSQVNANQSHKSPSSSTSLSTDLNFISQRLSREPIAHKDSHSKSQGLDND